MKIKLLIPILLLAVSTGCTITRVGTPEGASMWSVRLADWTKIGKVQVGSATLEGYDSDRQTAAVQAMEVAKEALSKVPAAP